MPTLAIRSVSLIPPSGSTSSTGGRAPDVQSFQAGTIQPDGSMSQQMHFDALNTQLITDYRVVAAANTSNFKGILISVRIDDGNGGYQYLPSKPIKIDSFTLNDGNLYFSGYVEVDTKNLPPAIETWRFICSSINDLDAPNVDSNGYPTGPYVDLNTLLPPAIGFSRPDQPTASDWGNPTAIANNHNNQTGENVSQMRAPVFMVDRSDITIYTLFHFAGAAPPVNLDDWEFVANTTKATLGQTTFIDWQEVRQDTSTTWQYGLVAWGANYVASAKDIVPSSIKSYTVNPISIPTQLSNLTIGLLQQTTGTGIQGKLRASVVVPSDLEIDFIDIQRVETDASFTPLAGKKLATIMGEGVLPGQRGVSTVLSAAIVSTVASSFNVADSSAIRAGDILSIDNEKILVNSVGTGQVTSCVRGIDGTTAATHINTSIVNVCVVYTQPEWWDWLPGASYWHFVAIPESRAGKRNETNPPSFNLSIGANPGLNFAYSDLTKVGSGIIITSDGKISVKNGSGIAFDGAGNITINEGVGLEIDGSGFLKVKTGTALSADSTGVFIPGGAITNSLLAALSVATGNIQDAAVATAKIGTNAVDTTKIANAAITTAKIGSAQITTALIGTAQVTTALIANAAITNALLGSAVVGTANIQNAAITNALVANAAIGTLQVVDGSITNAKISDLSVSKLSAGTATFSGDVTLQRTSGGPRVVLNSSGVAMYSNSAAGVFINTTGDCVITNSSGVSTTVSGNTISTGGITTVFCTSNQYDTGSGGTYKVFGTTVINSLGQFVGAGVVCTAFGVAAAGFNPYVSGQWFGQNYDLRAAVTVTTLGQPAFIGWTRDNGFSYKTYLVIRGGAVVDMT